MTRMFTGAEFVATVERLGFTHVVWLPDSTFGPWESDLASSDRLRLVRICREGEAWPLAAGLWLAGAMPLVMMQTTGLYESGDSMRNVLFDLGIPLYALIGGRNLLVATSRDSAKRFAEPILAAWGVDYRLLSRVEERPQFSEHVRRCRDAGTAGVLLLAEGSVG